MVTAPEVEPSVNVTLQLCAAGPGPAVREQDWAENEPSGAPKETEPVGPTPLTVAVQVQDPGECGTGLHATVVVLLAFGMTNVAVAIPETSPPGELLW